MSIRTKNVPTLIVICPWKPFPLQVVKKIALLFQFDLRLLKFCLIKGKSTYGKVFQPEISTLNCPFHVFKIWITSIIEMSMVSILADFSRFSFCQLVKTIKRLETNFERGTERKSLNLAVSVLRFSIPLKRPKWELFSILYISQPLPLSEMSAWRKT